MKKRTVKDITRKIIKFRDARDWMKFHNPKDMAISLSLEASELLEHFQWKTPDEIVEGAGHDHRGCPNSIDAVK